MALERDQPRPVFGHDGVVVLGERVVEQIGQAQPPIRLAPQIFELLEKHLLSSSRHARSSRGSGTVGRIRAGGGAQMEARAG